MSKNWLLDCHKLQKRVPLRNYLVGDAISPIDDVEDDDEEVLSSQSVVHADPRDLRGKAELFHTNLRK